jgi:hypothetical protein
MFCLLRLELEISVQAKALLPKHFAANTHVRRPPSSAGCNRPML